MLELPLVGSLFELGIGPQIPREGPHYAVLRCFRRAIFSPARVTPRPPGAMYDCTHRLTKKTLHQNLRLSDE